MTEHADQFLPPEDDPDESRGLEPESDRGGGNQPVPHRSDEHGEAEDDSD